MKNLLICAALALSPDQFDSPQKVTGDTAPIWTGNLYLSLSPSYNIDEPLSPKVGVIKLCSGFQKLTPDNNFGALGVQHGCVYMALEPSEMETLADNIQEWLKEPYISHSIYVKQLN